MATKRVGVGGVLLGCLLVGVVVVAANPLRLPEPIIQRWLLHEKPLGTKFLEVRGWLEGRRWLDETNQERAGLFWDEPGEPPQTIGTTSLAAHLGHYRGIPWHVDVEAFWAFDNEGCLIAVKVRKDADAI